MTEPEKLMLAIAGALHDMAVNGDLKSVNIETERDILIQIGAPALYTGTTVKATTPHPINLQLLAGLLFDRGWRAQA